MGRPWLPGLCSFFTSCLIVFADWKFSGLADLTLPYLTEVYFFWIPIHPAVSLSVSLFKLEVSYETLILPPLVSCSPGQIIPIPRVIESSNLRARRISFFNSPQLDVIALYYCMWVTSFRSSPISLQDLKNVDGQLLFLRAHIVLGLCSVR